jgi:RHS repeat-associated protein
MAVSDSPIYLASDFTGGVTPLLGARAHSASSAHVVPSRRGRMEHGGQGGGGAAASNLTTYFTYDNMGELTQVTDPNGNTTSIAYTPVGLVASITDAQGNTTAFTYDLRGNRLTSTNALNQTTTYTYDVMNRLTLVTAPDGSTTQFAYDYRGRRISVTDANGKATAYQYDDADRLVAVIDAAQNLTSYAYDTENNLLKITDALGRATGFAYNAMGLVTQVTFPSSLSESYTYDAVNNLLSKTDRDGHTINYTYDSLNRLSYKAYPNGSGVNYSYDLLNHLTQAADPTGTYSFTYDSLGRLTGTSTQYAFLSGRTLTNSYTYDADSNRLSLTNPQNGVTNYTYDSLNRLTGIDDFAGRNFSFSYDALGRRTSLTRPNGVNTTYTYDSLSRLLSVLHQAGSTALDGAAYTYDAAGNRTSRTTLPADATYNYSYDPIYELTQATLVSTGKASEKYTYDAVGNRLTQPGVPYTYNSSNEMLTREGVPYTHDANGNTLSKTNSTGTTSYTWDYENRLTSLYVPGTGTVSFKYDPFGRRIENVSPSGTTIYVYDGNNIIEELNADGSMGERYTYGPGVDEPLVGQRQPKIFYYEADGLGSITSLTDPTGAVAATYTYDSFGFMTASTGSATNWFRYTGRQFDSTGGLYYYRARYYDPLSGRFLSEDPIRFQGGINFYAYVRDNPTGFSDPSGLLDVLIWNGTGSAGKPPWGHAAILLDDGTYISWWPGSPDDPNNPNIVIEDGGTHFARNARIPSYADDVSASSGEGHGPDEDIYIDSLNEAAIEKWWNGFQKNKLWDSYNRNCSDAAMGALNAGGAGNFVRQPHNLIAPTSPSDVLKYAQQLQLYNSWNSISLNSISLMP